MEDHGAIAADIESYLVRREICRMGGKNYNNVFRGFIKALKTPQSARAEIRKALAQGNGKSVSWPTDQELCDAMTQQHL